MENMPKIRFYKERPFSEKLNATFEFIRQNFKVLVLSILMIIGPIVLISSFLMAEYTRFTITEKPDPFEMLSNSNYWGGLFLLSIGHILNVSIVYNIMVMYKTSEPDQINVGNVVNAIWKDIIPIFFMGLIVGIMAALGFILFIIPGVYLIVVLSLALPVLFFEKKGIFDAIDRCFKLVKDNWWSTFGIMFISGLISSMLGYVFNIPVTLITVMDMLSEHSGDYMAQKDVFDNAGTVLLTFISQLGSTLVYMIPLIAIAFQYFNLAEKLESFGLKEDIEALDSGENDTDVNKTDIDW